MLQVETLSVAEKRGGKELYEEPDGELLKFISNNNRTISVLTRVDEDSSGKGVEPTPDEDDEDVQVVESPPVDPSEMTVSELQDSLSDEDYDWNEACLIGLLEAEEDGKDRKTATNAIEEKLEQVDE